jgi:lipopolysaccharide/colanic/teichoic acid biosynthesis glycosyltransferase
MDAHLPPFAAGRLAHATPSRARAAVSATPALPMPDPDGFRTKTVSRDITPVNDQQFDEFTPNPRSEVVARMFNLASALLMLIVASPVMLITALFIRMTSRGPIFYMQTRVGLDRRWNRTRALRERRGEDLGGVPFTIYKFRSMRVDAEANGQAVWAQQNDDRITFIGKIIRKTRTDELPQLWNVLRGDMNIVGPRPERPSIFVRLRESIEEYPIRQRVKPGITGLAQINNSYDTCLDDVRRKVVYDLEYLRTQSLTQDLRIMLRTIPVMVFRIGSR